MSATLPDPGIDVEVCLGIAAEYPDGVWDSGTFDFNVWVAPDTSMGGWLDVTCLVDRVRLAAGSSADGVVTRWEAQTCSFTILGETFDPRSGPYAGILGPGVPVRVRWRVTGNPDWLTTFTGYIDDGGFTYDPKAKTAAVAATDGTRIFAAYDGLEQSPQGANETAAQRVTRIADMVGWPADQRDIQPGGVALQPTTLAQEAWSMLLAVADTDLGILWLNRAGKLAYRPQGKVLPQRQLAAIIGCGIQPPAGVSAIEPLTIHGQQPNVTRNIVSVSRQAPEGGEAATVTLRDERSVARFLAHSYQRTDLLHVDDAWSTTVAEAILMASAWPSTAPESAELSSRADPKATVLLLGLEPSLSVQVTDGVGTWLCEPSGWDVEISRREVAGTIQLLDISTWYGSAWDSGAWDIATWGW